MDHDDYSVESVAGRIAAVGPQRQTGVLEVAEALPLIYRELVSAVGDAEGRYRFDKALTVALASAY